jgi:tryptophan-rich sensory protein
MSAQQTWTEPHRAGRLAPVAVAALAAVAVGLLGGTMSDIDAWYYGLTLPAWTPPEWAFAPIWTAIFATVALSAAMAWRAAPNRGARDAVVLLFTFNGFLNVVWSGLFFAFHRPDWALFEVVFLWASIVVLMLAVARYSRPALLLLVPYLAWVGVAAVLNLEVVRLNGPFG